MTPSSNQAAIKYQAIERQRVEQVSGGCLNNRRKAIETTSLGSLAIWLDDVQAVASSDKMKRVISSF